MAETEAGGRGGDGNAVVWCAGAFGTTYGKTAHGLVRRSRRWRVVSVIDPEHAGRDAGEVLDGRPVGIPIHPDLPAALEAARAAGAPATHLVIGVATEGGVLPPEGREVALGALREGLHVVSGLHTFLSEDPALAAVAAERGLEIVDVRKPPPRDRLRFWSGKIREVRASRIAVLGTDSAVGKRTTAWILTDALEARGIAAEMIGTGQTAWMQGARYGIVLDSLVNDFVTGEIEGAVWRAWEERRPRAIVLEGQGGLLHPAFPGGFEILAAARPHAVVLQHAPTRTAYDGFPDIPIHPLEEQIRAVELVGGCPVAAIALNHEGIPRDRIAGVCREVEDEAARPAFDVLLDGADGLVETLLPFLEHEEAE